MVPPHSFRAARWRRSPLRDAQVTRRAEVFAQETALREQPVGGSVIVPQRLGDAALDQGQLFEEQRLRRLPLRVQLRAGRGVRCRNARTVSGR